MSREITADDWADEYLADIVLDRDELAPVRADDTLLDALGARDTRPGAAVLSDALSALLYGWRCEADAHPVGVLVDTDTALTAIGARPARPTWWARLTGTLRTLIRRP